MKIIEQKELMFVKLQSLKNLFTSSIKEITLNIKSKEQLNEIQNFLMKKVKLLVTYQLFK